MGSSAMPSRRRAAATALVTVSLVLAGAVLPAAPAAAATVLPPWTAPVTLSTTRSAVQDVVVTKDGTAVAVWTESGSGDLYAARRPANSDTWSSRVKLGETVGLARLAARPDGSVAALWADSGSSGTFIASAVLGAGQSAWSQPQALVTDSAGYYALDLAVGPGGTLAAVWERYASSTSEVFVSTLTGDDGWSAPVQVSNAAAYGRYATVGSPQVAWDGQGGLVVSYWMSANGTYRVMTTARPSGTSAWPTPQLIASSRELPTLASAPDGSVHLVWLDDANHTFQIARRADAASDWGLPQTAASAVGDVTLTPDPLIAPDGDVSLVWFDRATSSRGVKVTRFDSSTGAWSTPSPLSVGYAEGEPDASVARDGSVHVLWPELDADQQADSLWEATLADGQWASRKRLGGGRTVSGRIAADTAGTATAVWYSQYSDSVSTYVAASRSAWPALKMTGSTVPGTVPLKGTTSSSAAWKPVWTTNSAVASWTLTLTDTAGKVVRTLTGTADPATGSTSVAPVWNGRTGTGAVAVNGRLTWTLKAVQWGSGTASALGTGTVTVTGGSPAFRDFGGHNVAPDGFGDLLLLDSSGHLDWALGSGRGDLETGASGTGWATTIKAVPFGDLSGDRCNDVLVRLSSGAVRLYKPACGAALKPSTPYTTLATSGWNQYDVLTHPGDITKDGRPDLIARNASTGAIYLYKGTSTGKLSARVKLYDNWKTYKKIVGTGDLNGDGIGDLIAQDKSNNLYRYLGKGNGTFSARVKLFANWGASYNTVIGTGDITGDGRTDLIARDTAGNLYRQSGTGTGTYGGRVKIGGGYSRYKALF